MREGDPDAYENFLESRDDRNILERASASIGNSSSISRYNLRGGSY